MCLLLGFNNLSVFIVEHSNKIHLKALSHAYETEYAIFENVFSEKSGLEDFFLVFKTFISKILYKKNENKNKKSPQKFYSK